MKAVASATLVALGAMSASAMAADVELYGRIDGGLQFSNFSEIEGKAVLDKDGNVLSGSKFGLVSGHTNGSRWGLRGSEKLGGGTRAVFVLESGFSVDDGMSTQGGRLFGREARMGLENKRWGSIGLGRFGGLSSGTGGFNMMKFDPFATAWDLAGMKAFSFTNKRLDNAVAYETPKMAGVSATAMYSFATSGQEVAGADNNERYAGLGANYKRGNLQAALIYEEVELQASKNQPTQKSVQLGAYYDFPIARAYFNYERSIDVAVKGAPSGSISDANSYMVGFKAPLPGKAGELLGSYQYRDVEGFAYKNQNIGAGLSIFSLGYLYPLSKRTQIYASYVASVGSGAYDKDAVAGKGGFGFSSGQITNFNIQRAAYNSQVATIGLRTRF